MPSPRNSCQGLINEGKVTLKEGGEFKGRKNQLSMILVYLGRANGVYEAPRDVIKALDAELVEMKRCKTQRFMLWCPGGAAKCLKMLKKGIRKINIERTEEALDTGAEIIAAGCPFCMTMMTDGVKNKEREHNVKVFDLGRVDC